MVRSVNVIFILITRERLVEEYERTGELLVDLGSDQTSCHNPYLGGYYPVQVWEEQPLKRNYTIYSAIP